jgi:hypothetical protein
MAYLLDTGISAQKLAASIYRHVRGMKTAEPREIVAQGLDGGSEFRFLVKSRDGRELIVSVIEESPPEVQAKHRPSQAERIVAAKQQRYIEAQERRRKRFLGEL